MSSTWEVNFVRKPDNTIGIVQEFDQDTQTMKVLWRLSGIWIVEHNYLVEKVNCVDVEIGLGTVDCIPEQYMNSTNFLYYGRWMPDIKSFCKQNEYKVK